MAIKRILVSWFRLRNTMGLSLFAAAISFGKILWVVGQYVEINSCVCVDKLPLFVDKTIALSGQPYLLLFEQDKLDNI